MGSGRSQEGNQAKYVADLWSSFKNMRVIVTFESFLDGKQADFLLNFGGFS